MACLARKQLHIFTYVLYKRSGESQRSQVVETRKIFFPAHGPEQLLPDQVDHVELDLPAVWLALRQHASVFWICTLFK